MEQTRNIIKLPLDSCITVTKEELIDRLTNSLEKNDAEDFKLLCKRIEKLVRANRVPDYKELLASYQYFNPTNENVTLPSDIQAQEQKFLQKFFQLMEACKYKPLSDEEWNIAMSSRYLLKLPIKIDRNKLDKELLSEYFGGKVCEYSNNQFVIFRQGISSDKKNGFFFLSRLHELQQSLRDFLVSFLCFGESEEGQKVPRAASSAVEAGETRFQEIERFHVGDIRISNLFRKARLQEPKFEHVIVLYRRSQQLGIHIKHYVDVPMADMELVLPAKTAPKPSPANICKFILSAVIGSVLLKLLLKTQRWTAVSIFILCMLYCMKLLMSFLLRFWRYKHMLKEKLLRDKRLKKHEEILVNLSKDAVQQETKMAVMVYYVLMTQGKEASKEELCFLCEELIEKMFKKRCIFHLDDALATLQNLGIVVQDASQKFRHLPLQEANSITDVHPNNHRVE